MSTHGSQNWYLVSRSSVCKTRGSTRHLSQTVAYSLPRCTKRCSCTEAWHTAQRQNYSGSSCETVPQNSNLRSTFGADLALVRRHHVLCGHLCVKPRDYVDICGACTSRSARRLHRGSPRLVFSLLPYVPLRPRHINSAETCEFAARPQSYQREFQHAVRSSDITVSIILTIFGTALPA